MGPPKANARKAQQKAARRELQQKKAAGKEHKKRQKQGEVDGEETPIEVLLQQLEDEQRQRQIKAQAIPCNQPSPRAHASLTLLPSGELLLFGGESYDGKKVRVYGDLFKWDMDKSDWRRFEAGEMPKARCSHQAAYHNGALYVFGGEFSTYYQFHHFKDFWRFDLKSSLWSQVMVDSPTHVPSARSGHRVVVWRGLLVLFGGFHDTGRETRYYNDLYIFSFSENRWRKVDFPPHAHIPEPRAGCVFVLVGDLVLLHGGFAKVRDTHRRVQGKTYTDSWLLDLKPLAKEAFTQAPTWEKVKNSGTPPSPRTGMCATAYKTGVVVFGGVADQDDGGSNLVSLFFNDLYLYDIPKRRWYPLELKSGRKKGLKKQFTKVVEQSAGEDKRSSEAERGEKSSDDEDWHKAFAYFDSKGRLVKLQLEDLVDVEPVALTCSPAALQHRQKDDSGCPAQSGTADNSAGPSSAGSGARCGTGHEGEPTDLPEDQASVCVPQISPSVPTLAANVSGLKRTTPVYSADLPLPRLHGMLLVRGSNLILMGGIMELGSKEITLDDCWSLNLNKRDRWVRVLEGTMHEQEWQGPESDVESSTGESGDDDSSSNCDLEGSESFREGSGTSDSDDREGARRLADREGWRCGVREAIQQLRVDFSLDDPMQTPAQGESLKGFFERTKPYWMERASSADGGKKSTKEVTRSAFEAASARVAAIADALRRMDELLLHEQREGEDDDRPAKSRFEAGQGK